MNRLLCLVLILGLVCDSANADRSLDIPPVYQKTPEWCWASVEEMIFKYYGVPPLNNLPDGYQCGILGLANAACRTNCLACTYMTASAVDATKSPQENVRNTLRAYTDIATRLSKKGILNKIGLSAWDGQISSQIAGTLAYSAIKTEINAERPIIIAFSPTGKPSPAAPASHVALLIGYYDKYDLVFVNDPFPYQKVLGYDPLISAGATLLESGTYGVPYSVLINKLGYSDSITNIQCTGPSCPALKVATDPKPVSKKISPLPFEEWLTTVVTAAYDGKAPFEKLKGKKLDSDNDAWTATAKAEGAYFCVLSDFIGLEYDCSFDYSELLKISLIKKINSIVNDTWSGWSGSDKPGGRTWNAAGDCGPGIELTRSGTALRISVSPYTGKLVKGFCTLD